MPAEFGAQIAAHALALVGTPFRLHGRQIATGLDCVGVVAQALASTGFKCDVSADYHMRGDHLALALGHFDVRQFARVDAAQPETGDVQLCQPGVRQLHFAVLTQRGAVHAHAGLRRVVLTPLPLPWPVIGQWRFIGG